VQLLLERGISVSANSHDGDTALHLAVKEQRYNIIEILLRYGADFNSKNDAGKSPFDLQADKFIGKNLILCRILMKRCGKS
jgi:ankyrin repeat protein